MPFAPSPVVLPRGARWVRPQLVAEVGYTELTGDGLIRHGVFAGLRDDNPAQEVTMERSAATRAAPKRRARAGEDAIDIAGVRLTHPGKLLDPQTGLTKRALAEYFMAVAPRMLPHVKDRPISLVRCPDGRRKPCFFQRHATDGMPAAIGTVTIREKAGSGDYLVLRDAAGLVASAQIGALELHVWGARADDIERPDRLVFDLDPDESLAFAAVRDAALELKDILADAGLVAWPLVTGGKGVHLVVPLQRRHPWPVVAAFAKGFAERIAEADPARFVAAMSKARRKGRIFIDHFRNQRSASAIAPWSPRNRDGAPVAMPVSWAELARLDRADAFDLVAARRRAAGSRDPWAGNFSRRQSLTAKVAAALGIELDF